MEIRSGDIFISIMKLQEEKKQHLCLKTSAVTLQEGF